MTDIERRLQVMLGRKLDAEDHRLLGLLVGHLPAGALQDDGFLAEIVLKVEGLREFRRITEDAANGARKRAEIDGEQCAMAIARKAWRLVMDNVPVDNADRLRRNARMAVIWSAMVFAVATAGGYELRQWQFDRHRATMQATTELAFGECIDAANGRATAPHNSHQSLRFDVAVFERSARLCAADYADRRAKAS